jgi:hypothetical protein
MKDGAPVTSRSFGGDCQNPTAEATLLDLSNNWLKLAESHQEDARLAGFLSRDQLYELMAVIEVCSILVIGHLSPRARFQMPLVKQIRINIVPARDLGNACSADQ